MPNDRNKRFTPEQAEAEVDRAVASQVALDPRMSGVDVKPMGWLARLFMSSKDPDKAVLARHISLLPGQNTVYYDAEAIAGLRNANTGPTIPQTVAHELEHAKQRMNRGWLRYLIDAVVKEPRHAYGAGPLEGAALDAENALYRKFRNSDVTLPPEREVER